VIVLDEPTIGLDPAQNREIRGLIRELGDTHSVILSTHLLSEVESVCDRVEIMQQGKLIYSDTSEHMREHGSVSGFIVVLLNPPPLHTLEGIAGIRHVEPLTSTKFRVLHKPEDNPKSALISLAEQQGWQLEQLTPLQATLEEVYVRITESENRNELQDINSSVRAEPVEAHSSIPSTKPLVLSKVEGSGRTGESS